MAVSIAGTIRRAESSDIPAVMRLLHQVADVHHAVRPDLFKPNGTKYTPEELTGIFRNNDTPVFVFETVRDNAPAVLAYAFCIFQQKPDDTVMTPIRTLYIDDLCVDQDFRGCDIGRRMFEHVREFARLSGCYNLTLNVWEGNNPAKAFYERCGLSIQKTGMEILLRSESVLEAF